MFRLMLFVMLLFAMSSLAIAQDADVLEPLLGLHPAVGPALVVIWGAMKIADIFISEGIKASWPALVRKPWDWVLLHVGQSRNEGSVDAKK